MLQRPELSHGRVGELAALPQTLAEFGEEQERTERGRGVEEIVGKGKG